MSKIIDLRQFKEEVVPDGATPSGALDLRLRKEVPSEDPAFNKEMASVALAQAVPMPVSAEKIFSPAVTKIVSKKKRSHWLGNILYVIVLMIIVLGLPRFLSWALHTPYPMAAITSGSMWPVLKVDDLVFIQGGLTRADLKLGDIIVYHNHTNNTLTIHRLVQMNEDNFITKGDANFSNDEPAAYSDIIGRSLTLFGKPVRIPFLGSVTIFANSLREAQKI